MIEIFRRKYGLIVHEIFFATEMTPCASERDIDVYIQCGDKINGSVSFWTAAVDLRCDDGILFSNLARNYRYEINRALEKDNLIVEINCGPTPENVHEFVDFFKQFSLFRKVHAANAAKLLNLQKSGCLVIASVCKPGSKKYLLAMNCYITDGVRSRLYYSATVPRTSELKSENQLLGRANKLLHWRTMIFMKNKGIVFYDFGGISKQTELKGIDNFKLQFGGVVREEFNVMIGVSMLGKIALRTKKMIGGIWR